MSQEGPVIPYHSREHKTCVNCQHWREATTKDYAYAPTPQGYMLTPVHDLKNENRLPEKAKIYTMSYCTAVPTWQLMPSFHYCGQWKRSNEHKGELFNG